MSFYKEVPGLKTTLESTLKFDEVPTAGSTNPVTSDGVAKSNADILDDGDGSGEEEEVSGSTYYNSHVVGKFYFEQGKLWKCTNKTRTGEPGSYTYTTKMTKLNGVIAIANDIVDRGDGGYKTVTLPPIVSAPYNVPVRNREFVTISDIGAGYGDEIQLQLADDCTDALVFFENKKPSDISFDRLKIMRSGSTAGIQLFGKNNVCGVEYEMNVEHDTLVSTSGDGCTLEVPTDWSEVEVAQRITDFTLDKKFASNSSNKGFLIEIKGKAAILHTR